jgi:hypothetical protein
MEYTEPVDYDMGTLLLAKYRVTMNFQQTGVPGTTRFRKNQSLHLRIGRSCDETHRGSLWNMTGEAQSGNQPGISEY